MCALLAKGVMTITRTLPLIEWHARILALIALMFRAHLPYRRLFFGAVVGRRRRYIRLRHFEFFKGFRSCEFCSCEDSF